MKSSVDREGKRAVVFPPEKMTHELCEDLSKTLDGLVSAGAREIVINLEKTRQMDSASLGVLIFFRKNIADQGAEIVIANAKGQVKTLMENAGLYKLFRIISTLEAV